MTKNAIQYIKANGKDKAYAEFGNLANTTFHDRDLYVFVYDLHGVARARGVNPKVVGKNLIDMRDGDGKYIIKGFIAVGNSAAGKGWFEYKWPNPASKQIESKAAYVERLDDIIVGSGIYK